MDKRNRGIQSRKMATGIKALPFALVTQVLGVTAIALVLIWCISFRGGLAWEGREATNKGLIFNIHPVLMLLGLIVIGGEAIIAYKSLTLEKKTKKLIHLILHATSLILGIIGIYTAFKFHNESNIANLYSLHSWLGIGIIVLYGIQWIFGFVVFFFPGAAPAIRRDSLPWHVILGIFVYLLAVGNAALGLLEKLTFLENSGLAKYGTEAFLVNFTAIVTILFGTFVILTVISEPVAVDDSGAYTAIE